MDFYNLEKIEKFLSEINGQPSIYKNCLDYHSSDWRQLEDCEFIQPIQRRLGKYECVFDLDGVSEMDIHFIPSWLAEIGFKFIAWQSSETGMHIHFWTDMYGKEIKKALVKEMSKNIEEKFGVHNDLGPMGHEIIRAEYSVHPTKRTIKKLIRANLTPLFFKNEITPEMRQKISKYALSGTNFTSLSGNKDGKIPTCVRYMLSNTFSDGRERILFSLISWWKGSGKTENEIFDLATEWCEKQGYTKMSSNHIWSKVKTSQGRVGCRFRHALLEELGHPVYKCELT